MTWLTWGIPALALILSLLALRRARGLARRTEELEWGVRSVERRWKELPEELSEILAPLRVAVARLASGEAVPPSMIREGLPFLEITGAEGKALRDRDPQGVFLLDVRTPAEHASERIPGAVLVPIEEIEERYEREVPRGASKILVHCAQGERSRAVCAFLAKKGYANLYNLRDGIHGWPGDKEGRPESGLVQIEGLTRPPGGARA